MRFLTLATIAVAVLASVSALPADSVRDVGQTRKDIPLSKRTENIENSADATPADGAPPVPGSGQDNGAGAANDVGLGGTPQELGSLSKRNKKKEEKDAAAGQKNGGGATNPGDAPQGTRSLTKRAKNDAAATGQKNGGGATNPDDAPQGTRSLSKRTKNDQNAGATGQNNGATNDGKFQDSNALSKRAEVPSGGTAVGSGQEGGSPNTGTSPVGGKIEGIPEENDPDSGM